MLDNMVELPYPKLDRDELSTKANAVNYRTTKRSSGLPTPITNYYIFRITDLSILLVIFCKAIGSFIPISPVACDILQNWYCSSIT